MIPQNSIGHWKRKIRLLWRRLRLQCGLHGESLLAYPERKRRSGKCRWTASYGRVDYVFDTSFSADLTIMEEGNEFVERYQKGDLDEYPMFTSCCPGWVRFIKSQYPQMVSRLSHSKITAANVRRSDEKCICRKIRSRSGTYLYGFNHALSCEESRIERCRYFMESLPDMMWTAY